MQSNVDLCPRWSRSNSYRPPPLPSPVTYSPSCAIFHSCSSAEQILRFSIISNESSRSDYPPDTSDFGRAIAKFRGARSRVGSRPFSHGTFASFFIADNREGISEESLLATVALFLRNVSYSDIAPRVENRIVK